MTETNNAPVPDGGGQGPAPREGELRAELARVRGRNKTLKLLAGILLSLFIVIAAGGYYLYRKVTAAIVPFQEAFQSFPQPAAGYQPENTALPMVRGVYSSTYMPPSSLALLRGGLPGGSQAGGFDPGQGEQLFRAMGKYAKRPIVKAFLADLKKDPDMAAAFSAVGKGGNPLQVISLIQNSKGMNKVIMKYATRPEFLKLVVEFMNDPEMQPLLKNMPRGMAIPAGMPREAAVPVAPQSGVSRPSDEDGDGEMTFDPSVISGPAAKPAGTTTRKAPPPVDNGR
ncbi:MAG: hypothetical protein HY550_11825 [Elusimicrobia bacterium]|nr:hypothetical protein [Elusimicrobiota bacterium]